MPDAPGRSPSPIEIGVLVGVIVGSALAVRFAGGAVVTGWWQMTAASAVFWGLAFGAPALAFTFERGRATAARLVGLGALAGGLPLLMLGGSGVVGLWVRSGAWDSPSEALALGLPIPAAGIIYWARFLRLELQTVLLGATSALMFWLVMVRARPDRRALNILLALFALGTLATVSTLLR